ncbi:MAG: acetylglutamate kinase [Myxococcales bacterium]|nr:acetylglutamate kinase [Myxococcales bacterium]
MKRRNVLVKIGGATLIQPADRALIARDLKAVAAQGHNLCVVHGGGPQATALARQLGHEPTFRGGRRVTDAAMLDIVKMALVGEAGTNLLAACLGEGVQAVGLSASSGRWVTAKRRPPRLVAGESEAVDFGYVADVESVHPKLLQTLWAGDFVPVLSSVVIDDAGQPLNLNADTLVRSLCEAMPFDDVFFVADVPGVFEDLARPESHIPSLRTDQVPELIEAGVVQGGMIAKLTEMTRIVGAGVASVWIVGLHEDAPVSSALSGQAGLRTQLSA